MRVSENKSGCEGIIVFAKSVSSVVATNVLLVSYNKSGVYTVAFTRLDEMVSVLFGFIIVFFGNVSVVTPDRKSVV